MVESESVSRSTVVRALAPATKKTPAPETNSHKEFVRKSRLKKKGRYERRPGKH